MAQKRPSPPGWYRDPEQPGTQRYWDGGDWTDQRAPMQESRSSGPSVGKIALGVFLGLALAAVVGAVVVSGEKDKAELEYHSCVLDSDWDEARDCEEP